jgi:HEAT repeat protein
MSELDKDPISSALTLKIVIILAAVTIVLAIPLVYVYETKKEMERLAEVKAEEDRKRAIEEGEKKKRLAEEEAKRKATQEAADREAAKQESLRDVTMQTLVPLPGQENKKKIEQSSEWADASIYAVQHGNVLVSVDDLREDEHLKIKLSVKNIESGASVAFKGWGGFGENVQARLEDHVGRTLNPTKGAPAAPLFTPCTLVPAEPATNWIAFDGSIVNLSFLRLELPASAFGGYGKLRLQIPRTMMVFKAAPSLGDKAVPLLVELLQDKSPAIRIGAAFSLEGLAKDAAAAVPDLAKALQDPNEDVHLAAARALARIGPSARNALKEILEALGDSNPKIGLAAEAALQAMGQFGKEDASVLCACLKSPKMAVRAYAANTLDSMGRNAVDAVPALTETLNDSDAGLRRTAASALGKIGAPAKSAIPALTLALKDRDKSVREKAVQSLVKMGSGLDTVSALLEGLKNEDENVVEIAEKALDENNWLTADNVHGLVEVVQASKTKARIFAMAALGRIGPDAKEAVTALMDELRDLEASVREAAASALGKIGPHAWKAADGLAKALSDDNPKVQISAALALRGIGPDGSAAAPKLAASLKIKTLHEASSAALVRMGNRVVPALINGLEETKDFQERVDIISVLEQMGPDASDAIPILTTLSKEGQYVGTRKAASKALERIQAKK